MKTADLKSKLKSCERTKLLRPDIEKPIIRKTSTIQFRNSDLVLAYICGHASNIS